MSDDRKRHLVDLEQAVGLYLQDLAASVPPDTALARLILVYNSFGHPDIPTGVGGQRGVTHVP